MYGFRARPRISDIFIEVYSAYPASVMFRDDIDTTNSIILPPSALRALSNSGRAFGDRTHPMLFRILNIDLNIHTNCSVLDFTADEGTCLLPKNMFERLCLFEGQKVNIRNIELPKGTFLKIRPHQTKLLDQGNQKTILEYCLQNYFCVTEGDTISIKVGSKIYDLDIIEVKPLTKDKGILLLNTDVEVDFDQPKDYIEPAKNDDNSIMRTSSVNFNSKEKPKKKLNQEEMDKIIQDQKFTGNHFRMDGKKIGKATVEKIEKNRKIQKDAEENYNPREQKIESNPRMKYHFVQL